MLFDHCMSSSHSLDSRHTQLFGLGKPREVGDSGGGDLSGKWRRPGADPSGGTMEWKSTCFVLGAIMINLTLGTFYSIGNVVPYMASYMREHGNPDVTTAHGTWIVATFLLGQGISIIAGSYLEQRFNSRVACMLGCALHCISTFMTIWAIRVNIATVILVYGFGCGLGCGSAYMASIIAAQKWFPERKGFFTGLIVAGFGFGGLIFTNLQTLYLNPDNLPPNDRTGNFGAVVADRVPSMFMWLGVIFTLVQSLGCVLAFPAPASASALEREASQAQLAQLRRTRVVGVRGEGPAATLIYGDELLPDMTSVWSAFRYKIFYIVGLLMMLVAPGVTFVNSLGKRYGQAMIPNDRYLATVVAVAAVANATGRLTWGYLMDRLSFSRCFLIKAVLFASLIALFPFEFVLGSKLFYLLWMLGLFFGFSGTFVLFPVFIEQVFGAKHHGVVYGILYIFLAVSSILMSWIIQETVGPALADTSKNATEKLIIRLIPCISISCAYLLSIAILFFGLPVRRLEMAICRKRDHELTKTRTSLANRPDLLVTDRNLLNLEHNMGANASNNNNNNDAAQRENSLGSIVRFAEATPDAEAKVRQFNRFNNWR